MPVQLIDLDNASLQHVLSYMGRSDAVVLHQVYLLGSWEFPFGSARQQLFRRFASEIRYMLRNDRLPHGH